MYFRNELQLADEIKHKKEYKDRPVLSKLLDRERSNKAPKPKKLSDLDPHWWRNKPDVVVKKPDLDLMGDSDEDDSSEDKETPEEKKERYTRLHKRRAKIKREKLKAAQSSPPPKKKGPQPPAPKSAPKRRARRATTHSASSARVPKAKMQSILARSVGTFSSLPEALRAEKVRVNSVFQTFVAGQTRIYRKRDPSKARYPKKGRYRYERIG